MTHVRRSIREQVAATVTGLTTTGSRVFQSRVFRLEAADLPCLLVYTKTESVELDTMIPRALNRDLTVEVEGYARGTSDVDDTLDLIAEECENALGADSEFTVGGFAKSIALENTEMVIEGDGDQPIGVVRLSFTVRYRTTMANAGTAI